MASRKPVVAIVDNHVGPDEYEELKRVGPESLDFKPELRRIVMMALDRGS
ncbi:MAG TPA: hypothetical protein VNN76_02590 [Bacteroidota bacterium]|nr:hypothetical protein [Bacteroidota bacterium]